MFKNVLLTGTLAALCMLGGCAGSSSGKKAGNEPEQISALSQLQAYSALPNAIGTFPGEEEIDYATDIITGAQDLESYLPLIRDRKICILSNQTGLVSPTAHLLDTLLSKGADVVCIMSPEHGFRGDADAGEHVASSTDPKTGIPIRSLYTGDPNKPSGSMMDGFDILLFDLQDVGTRFYTYYVTMAKMMEACAESGKKMIVLDRPNPIGFYVDGPILDMQYKSGIGYLPIPIVHGMTLGELAQMINGEKWLKNGIQCDLTVIKCKNYTHAKLYRLPIKPSPNLPDMRSIYLYPSTCYFEGTPVSLGRGTDKPFQMYGHPDMKDHSFTFTPRSVPGAKNPPLLDQLCYGTDLRTEPAVDSINAKGVNLEYVIDAYNHLSLGGEFFKRSFLLETGRDYIKQMIMEGKSADQIKAEWKEDVEKFKEQRKPYLLYPEK